MPRTAPFEEHTDRYEEWFETFEAAYESELEALDSLRPAGGRGLEVGVGTGRFADPLDIEYGVEPAMEMLRVSADRGIAGIRGVAESLPILEDSFDVVLIVTTICFVDDVAATFEEVARVLEPGGHILVGYIDKESEVGRKYQAIKDENPFYRDATFHSTEAVLEELEKAGFEDVEVRQTIFEMPDEMDDVDPVRDGYGEGSFVALRAAWPGDNRAR